MAFPVAVSLEFVVWIRANSVITDEPSRPSTINIPMDTVFTFGPSLNMLQSYGHQVMFIAAQSLLHYTCFLKKVVS